MTKSTDIPSSGYAVTDFNAASFQITHMPPIEYTLTDLAKQVYTPEEQARLLKPSTSYSAGIDLRVCCYVWIDQERTIIPTGIKLRMSKSIPFFGLVSLRSSIIDITLTNGVGIIDQDYEGEILLSVRPVKDKIFLEPKQRIAQLVFIPLIKPQFTYIDQFDPEIESSRGQKGFGSTGQF